MLLSQVCRDITMGDGLAKIGEGHEIGSRLVCLEYSKSVQEVKTYPLLVEDGLFGLCWVMDGKGRLYATMTPSPQPFGYCQHFEDGSRTQLHTHDYIELGYVVEGELHQKILGRDIVFRKGEICLIDKNCVHQDYLINRPSVIVFLGLSNDMFDEVMDANVSTEKIVTFLQSALLKQKNLQQYLHFKPNAGAGDSMEECMKALLNEFRIHDAGSVHICRGLVMRIFRLLSTVYDFSLSKELRQEMNWLMFEEITKFITANYTTISIQQLTEEFHYQEDYFNRLIKNKTGMTYLEYVQSIRLDQAKKLLLSSDKSIDEIAVEVGYNNKGYFYKIFKERFGMTPFQLRKGNR
ncbi:MAG: AraC family transcriptional regulator [Clostridiales bacterium]|nr:AraC family transcriptional regulator [Clostridiales bacterium]